MGYTAAGYMASAVTCLSQTSPASCRSQQLTSRTVSEALKVHQHNSDVTTGTKKTPFLVERDPMMAQHKEPRVGEVLYLDSTKARNYFIPDMTHINNE